MKVREIFKIGGITQIIHGTSEYLTEDNCHIYSKTLNEDCVILRLKREADSLEGNSYLRVQDQFKDGTKQLLNWAFLSKEMIGLNLSQLREMDVNFNIELTGGRLTIK